LKRFPGKRNFKSTELKLKKINILDFAQIWCRMLQFGNNAGHKGAGLSFTEKRRTPVTPTGQPDPSIDAGFRTLKIRSFVAENAPQDDRFVVVLNEGRTWIWVPVILSVSEESGVGFTRIKNRSFTLLRMTNRFLVLNE